MINIIDIKFTDFIKDVPKYEKLLKLKSPFKNIELKKNKGEAGDVVESIFKYFIFVYNIMLVNNDITKTNTKLNILRSLNTVSFYLITDIISLLLNDSIYGMKIVSRSILEIGVINGVLLLSDEQTSQRFYDWQSKSSAKSSQKVVDFFNNYNFPKDDERYIYAKNEIEKNEFNTMYKGFKFKNSDYGWAANYLNEPGDLMRNNTITFTDILNKFDKSLILIYTDLNNYVHNTPLLVMNDELHELNLNQNKGKDIYASTFICCFNALNQIFRSEIYIFYNYNENLDINNLIEINKYYLKSCEKIFGSK